MAYTQLDAPQVIQQSFDEADNALRVIPISGLISNPYDYIAVTYPTATQEVYTFKTGGAGGTVVSTITVNYVDATKNQLLNVSKT